LSEEEVSLEIDGKYRQFIRVLMSYVDFQQAGGIASCILESDLLERYPKDRFHLQGLNSGMIVAYWRPFLKDREGKVPPLPSRILSVLDCEEKELHEVIREDRNKVVAHSDSEAWNPRPHYIILNGTKIFSPLFASAHAHLLRPVVEQLSGMCGKLREACFVERERLEQELAPYLPVVEPDLDELRSVAKRMGVKYPEY
jgi:hypothetical protein